MHGDPGAVQPDEDRFRLDPVDPEAQEGRQALRRVAGPDGFHALYRGGGEGERGDVGAGVLGLF